MITKLCDCVLDGITLERVVRNEEFVMPDMHLHPEFEIYYMFNGERYYFIENKTYHIRKGSLVLVDSMHIHKTSVLGKNFHDRFLIELNAEPFSTFFQNISGMSLADFFFKYSCVLDLDEQAQIWIERRFNDIMEEAEKKHDNYSILIMMKITEILLYVRRSHSERLIPPSLSMSDKPKHKMINEIATFITHGEARVRTLDEVCNHFFISKSYLCRVFKEVTGFTVQDYINIHSVKKAQQLLEQSDMSIAQIGERLGYNSVTYFERVFKKYTETTPLKYRKKLSIIKQKVRNKKQ
ncbi:helix-turn-helix transcriptional regulator [Cohnella hongkongensis]|uniref:AraC family transcriptional regulator n=1 Tax=Cohnella hongkongensis TaxID=178337 RepID=A0ABV9FD86_9BACL